jgi:hypothetical protein
MARLSKTDAARQLGIARATLYKLIAQGKVSPTADGLIDQAELVRVAPYIDTVHERTRTSTDNRERLQTSTDTLVDILREQLRLMQEREREHTRLYEAREQAYREHIAQLTTMLHEAHQQNQRLLDIPRGPLPPETRQEAPGAPQPPICIKLTKEWCLTL